MHESDDPNGRQTRLYDLIKHIRYAMFTTHSQQGHLHSRPMTTLNKSIEADDSLWFFMSRSGDPVAEFQGDDQVNVSYADPSRDAYVSVSGIARIVEDPMKKMALWNKSAESWFRRGVDDPDLALVQVRITGADYWDVKENRLVQLYRRAEAAITGRQPRMGEHGRVRPH